MRVIIDKQVDTIIREFYTNMESKRPKEQQINPAWLAAEKYQGSIIINDPAWR